MIRNETISVDLQNVVSVYVPRDETWSEWVMKYAWYYCRCPTEEI